MAKYYNRTAKYSHGIVSMVSTINKTVSAHTRIKRERHARVPSAVCAVQRWHSIVEWNLFCAHTAIVCAHRTIIKNNSQSTYFRWYFEFDIFPHLILGFVADSDEMAAVFCVDWLHGKGIKSFWKNLHCDKLVFLLHESAPEKVTWEECATNTSQKDLCHNIFGYVVYTLHVCSFILHTL